MAVLSNVFDNSEVNRTISLSSKWRIQNQPVVLAEVFVVDSAAGVADEAVVVVGDGVVEGVKPKIRR